LPTGLRVALVYAYGSSATEELAIDTVIDGPASFESQSLIQTTATTTLSLTIAGMASTTTAVSRSYQQSSAGVITNYGDLVTSTTISGGLALPGSATKIVFTPPFADRSYTLSLGQSVTQTQTTVTTVTAPTPGAPVTQTTTGTITYAADETITVRGKSYSTCRYEKTDDDGARTTTWYLVGKGVGVKLVSTAPGGATQTTELKSGTYNGSPL
jgi:hypothetical protein